MTTLTTNDFNQRSPSISGEMTRFFRWFGTHLHDLFARFIAYREQRRALAALSAFSDRELRDIGLDRCQLEAAVTGRLHDERQAPV